MKTTKRRYYNNRKYNESSQQNALTQMMNEETKPSSKDYESHSVLAQVKTGEQLGSNSTS